MLQSLKSRTFAWIAGTVVAVAAAAMFVVSATAQNKEPIKIGFSMALTGPLAANGKQALLGMKIWEEETNAKGGLLGRPVKLVYYDDQSNPSTVPGHLHQAARRRQSRPGGRRLCHQHGCTRDAGGHAEEENFHQPVRARREPRVQISEILLGATDRTRRPSRRSPRAYSRSRNSKIQSRQRLRWRPRTPSSRGTPARARARTPRPSVRRSSMTRPSRPARPTSRRLCAHCRRRMRTS